MTHMEAMAALAQGVINIDAAECAVRPGTAAALRTIEKGSWTFNGMLAIVEEESKTIECLKAIEDCLREGWNRRSIEAAAKLVGLMVRERTDPEFEG